MLALQYSRPPPFAFRHSRHTCIAALDDMQLIDTHNHLDLGFSSDFETVLENSRKAGLIAQILPGVSRDSWANLLHLSRKYADLFAAPGLHPMYLSRHLPVHLDELAEIAAAGEIIALGEIGLDYHIEDCDHCAQQKLFEAQLEIAADNDLPLLLHVRKAHDQVQAVIRRKRFARGGIVHAFSGSLQQARKYIQLGFKISFGGTITYDRATRVRAIADTLPLDAIVLETDAPDIPPSAYHGRRNSPEYLPLILEALAEIRPESKKDLARQTTLNALAVLQLGEKLKTVL